MSRISKYARFRPRQLRGPREKGLNADGTLDSVGSARDGRGESQREGLKELGSSGKLSEDRFEE